MHKEGFPMNQTHPIFSKEGMILGSSGLEQVCVFCINVYECYFLCAYAQKLKSREIASRRALDFLWANFVINLYMLYAVGVHIKKLIF